MSISYSNLTHHSKTIWEQSRLFLSLHYTEKMINAHANPGTMIHQLKDELRRVADLNFFEMVNPHAQVRMTGYFGHERSKIDFDFIYRYDPIKQRLNPKALVATINDSIQKEYRVVTTAARDIPPSGEVAKDLSRMLTASILKKIKEAKISQKKKGKRL